jgi:hypothetical protein
MHASEISATQMHGTAPVFNRTALSREKQNIQRRNHQQIVQQERLHRTELSDQLGQALSILQSQRSSSLDRSKELQSELDMNKAHWSKEAKKEQKDRLASETQLRRDILVLQKELKNYVEQVKSGVLTELPASVVSILSKSMSQAHSSVIF